VLPSKETNQQSADRAFPVLRHAAKGKDDSRSGSNRRTTGLSPGRSSAGVIESSAGLVSRPSGAYFAPVVA